VGSVFSHWRNGLSGFCFFGSIFCFTYVGVFCYIAQAFSRLEKKAFFLLVVYHRLPARDQSDGVAWFESECRCARDIYLNRA